MLKKLGTSCIIALTVILHANAESGIEQKLLTDTVDIQVKDSTLTVEQSSLKDPKQEFKELFLTNTSASNNINISQLNPLAVNFVEDYIDSHSKMLEKLKDKARPYFDMMDDILVKHGLPKELKYLAVIESELKSNATSWAGAVGPWQFMPETGRTLGLKINRRVDERRDIYKSTHAASRYLTNLYSLYGDWLLVIAAYNGGPGKVNVAIKRSGSRDFWTLQKYLPAESRKHVKKFIATHYIMEGAGGLTTLTKKESANFLLDSSKKPIEKNETENSVVKIVNGRFIASIIVKHLEMDIAHFNQLNPGFDDMVASNGKYEMRLPQQKMDVFTTKRIEILKESIQLLLNPNSVVSSSN